MDSDCELLALAAKAHGGRWKWVTCPKFAGKVPGFASLDTVNGTTGWPGWNPLEDDGDALRLAVKLQLSVSNEHLRAGAVVVCSTDEDSDVLAEEMSGTSADAHVMDADYAATRRAIVRAAAELGRRG